MFTAERPFRRLATRRITRSVALGHAHFGGNCARVVYDYQYKFYPSNKRPQIRCRSRYSDYKYCIAVLLAKTTCDLGIVYRVDIVPIGIRLVFWPFPVYTSFLTTAREFAKNPTKKQALLTSN